MPVRVLLEPPARTPHEGVRGISILRWLFLVIGVGAIGWSGYVYVDSHLYEQYEDWAFDQESHGKAPSIMAFLRDGLWPNTPESSPAATAPASPGSGEGALKTERVTRHIPVARQSVDPAMLGRIEIPRLEVHAMVREGVDDRTLRRSVGHVPGTAKPGDQGNVGLAGHRDSFFRKLKDIQKGDTIVVETLDSKYEYAVDTTKVVGPDDVKVLAPTPQRSLTLVTCYPFYYVGNAPRRFIVRARQVSVEARASGVGPAKSGS